MIQSKNSKLTEEIITGLRAVDYKLLKQYDSLEMGETTALFETQLVVMKNDIFFDINIS